MLINEQDHQEFFKDIAKDGFHIFSKKHAKTKRFYPTVFPEYPEIKLSDIKEDDRITIRAFFPIGKINKKMRSRIDGGYIDLEVEAIDTEKEVICANIITELPDSFALSAGTSLEIIFDEVLDIRSSDS